MRHSTSILATILTTVLLTVVVFVSSAVALGNDSAYCQTTTGQGPGTNAWGECVAEYDRYFSEFNCGSMGGSGTSGPQVYLDCLTRIENQLNADNQPTPSNDSAEPGLTEEEQAELNSLNDFNQGGEFDCNGVSTSIDIQCEAGVNPIYSYITAIVNFISAGVGIAIVANVMIGGVQYMLAGGNPQATQAALSRITNAFIALFAFIFMWAFFNWLIPGGVLN